MQINPFIYGKPVSKEHFMGRKDVLQTLISRILTGQSSAIIGEPHIGKTSLLYHLEHSRSSLFGEQAKQIIFSYMDSHMLGTSFTQAQFWEHALTPLIDWANNHLSESVSAELIARYQRCHENGFGNYTLGHLLALIDADRLFFVLLIDEFDAVVHYPMLNKSEFFGGLRSLASRCPGFVIIIASRHDLSELNRYTQDTVGGGSPFFNIFIDIKIGRLTPEEIALLLQQGEKRFSVTDHNYIYAVAGAHPYLLQSAAAAVWDAIDQNLSGSARYQRAGQLLYQYIGLYFNEIWKGWTKEERKVFTAVALTHIPTLLPRQNFASEKDLRDFYPEIYSFEVTGLLNKSESGQWRVTQKAMLWWLADELTAVTKRGDTFENWLQSQELDGVFTKEQKKKIEEDAQIVIELAHQGAESLINEMAVSIAEAK